MRYLVEKVRIYHDPEDIWDETKRTEKTLLETDSYDEAVKAMNKPKLRSGKTFDDEIHLTELDEHGDIINYLDIRKLGETKEDTK